MRGAATWSFWPWSTPVPRSSPTATSTSTRRCAARPLPGNADARIFALSMDPELISIAGIYRTSDTPLPAEVLGKPGQVRLVSGPEGDKLVIESLNP